MRRLALLIPLALIVLVLAVVQFGRDAPPRRGYEPRMVGVAVPPLDLPGLDALHPGLATADLERGTVTVVNLFASWCAPCRIEAPQLAALAKQGVVVHGIAVADHPADVAAFLRDAGDPFRRIGLDPKRASLAALRATGLPETYVIDGGGVVRHQHPGEIRPEHLQAIRAAIDAAR